MTPPDAPAHAAPPTEVERRAEINGSVGRALRLLLDITRSPEPKSFSELQRAHDLPKATLHKILATLEAMNFLRRDRETGRYTIGLAVLEMSAAAALGAEDISRLIEPVVERLVESWNETCHFGIFDGDQEQILLRVDPKSQFVRLGPLPTRRNALHASAGGLAMMALPDREDLVHTLPEPLTAATPNTLTTRKDLVARLEKVRRSGYALDLEEAYLGVRCIAVGLEVAGLPPMYLSFSLPLQRAGIETLVALAEPLRTAAREVERLLGVVSRPRQRSPDPTETSSSVRSAPGYPLSATLPTGTVVESR